MKKITFRTFCLRAALVCCLLSSACLSSLRADDLTVLKGSSAKIFIPGGVKKIAVANPSVADVKPEMDGQSVLISGLAEGNTELRVEGMQGGELVTNVVVRSDLNQMLAQIKDLLSEVEGLEIKAVGDKIVLRGKILTKSDYDQVSKVVAAYSGLILNLAKFDDSIVGNYAAQAILQDIGIDTVTARVVGDTVILEGVVYSQADLKRAEEIAHLKVPNVKNLLQVQDIMVETDVQFIEVSIQNGKNTGFNLLDTLGAAMSGSGSSQGGGLPINFGVSAGASSGILNMHWQNATGKIVAQPHLSTKSGEVGEFQSGGTTYFQIAGNVGGSLQSVDYGVILKVKPTVQGRDHIQNEVSIEVSLPVKDASGRFTLDKYTTKCTSLCKVGESMVMSGMTQLLASKSNDRTPLIGDVPLIDLFFSNKTANKDKKEFAIIVTPQPVFPKVATGLPLGEQHQKMMDEKNKD
ncbi:MAG: pilus assembly protein N-terminal domain-containing protein [Verrucomicrobiae bacterium]|nr:pilus assembly protein N-terminal domain-containing protein [Verrucomicrobiae bacterium]